MFVKENSDRKKKKKIQNLDSNKAHEHDHISIRMLKICGDFICVPLNEIFNYLSVNKLISKNQSGFQLSDSCINRLLSITHKIFTCFDTGLEVRRVFLDISKAFDKVWHEGIISKLKQNDISGELLHVLSDFLSSMKQREGCA